MQLAETLLMLYAAVNIFYFIFGKKSNKPLAFAGLALLLIHIILGETRWQVGPVYLIATIIILVHFFPFRASKWLKVPAYVLGIVFTVISGVLCYALPVFSLPKPTGSYTVASKTLYLKDESRQEDITPDPNDNRELIIDLWYPAVKAQGPTKPYLEPVERKGFALKYGLPEAAFHYLDGVKTQVYLDQTPVDEAFPVLIFSPGYYTPASGYHSILGDIASHGFIIFSINHSYETMGSRFPDGHEIFFDQAYADKYNWSEAMGKAVNEFDNAAEHEKREAIKKVNAANTGATLSVTRWSADITAVLDQIMEWNTDPAFALAGKMKLDQIGVFGHSRGGAAAVEASLFNDRIKAAANLDGAQWGNVIDAKLSKPTAVFSSAGSLLYEVNRYLFQNARSTDFYDIVVDRTGHSNFSDIPYMIGLSQLNEAGSIAPQKATASFNGFLVAFFDKHLSRKSIDLDAVVSGDKNLRFKE